MTAARRAPLTRFGALAFKAAVSAGLVWLVLERVDLARVGERIVQLSPGAIAAVLGLSLVQAGLGTLRWTIVSRKVGLALRFGAALRLLFVGLFFNQALVSSIGGDAVRIFELARSGAGAARAVYSVVTDRLVALAALLLMVLFGLPWLLDLVGEGAARSAIVLVLIAGWAGFLVLFLLDRAPLPPRRFRLVQGLDGLAVRARRVFFSAQALPAVLLSFAIHGLSAGIVWLIARSLALDAAFSAMLLLVPLVMLVSTLPISIAGWGVREGTMVSVLGFVGIAPADAFAVSVIFGLSLAATALPGGALWLAGRRAMRRDGGPALEEAAAAAQPGRPVP